jgi:uncharacterized protein (DUF58 family)
MFAMRVADFFRDKRSLRFALISSLLISAALGAAFISAAAAQIGEYELASFSSKAALALALGIVLYVIPRLARNVKLEYLRTSLALKITNAGWLFCLFVLVVATASLTTGNNLFYLVLSVLLATLIVSGLASRLSLSDVSVTLRFPDHIFAGESTQLEVTLANQKKWLPSFSLTIATTDRRGQRGPWQRPTEARTSFTQRRAVVRMLGELTYFAIVPGGTQAHARIERVLERRGIYPVCGFTVSTRFPFGFVERRRYNEASGELVVYPSPQPLDDFYHLLPITQGQMESLLKGSGSDLYAIRQYLRTDHPRHLDWKATAKTAQLMVREFTRDDDWRITIALDALSVPPAAPDGQPDAAGFAARFERAITLAASLITHFIAEGAEVRLVTGRDDLGFGSDNPHRYAMLRQLALLEPAVNEQEHQRQAEQHNGASGSGNGADGSHPGEAAAWGLVERMPALAADDKFKILITPAARGSIPATIWRSSHVVYFDDL